jgi:Tol biopolymer transport system component
MSGDWPKELSPVSSQELADHTVAELDENREHLTSVFTHDFTKDGLPNRLFEQERTDSRSDASPGPEGVIVVRPSEGKWSMHGLKLRFAALGDFDIEASFAGLQTESDLQAAIMLMIQLDDTDQHRCRLSRMQHLKSLQQLNPAVSVLHPDGRITYDGRRMACEAGSGKLRIARRGETVHFLFAENDSNVFRRVRSEIVSDRPTIQDGISLLADCNGNGTTRVVWKNVTMRAEGLKYLDPSPNPELRQLYAMKTDGSVRGLLTEPAPGYFHMGSPEWSADGKMIALDMSEGGVEASHVVVLNADGSELKDLGLGCMPSISHDGKSIVFSQLGTGVMMMDSDGSNRRIVDRAGWGVQYSPDGKRIAYGTYTNFTLMDTETQEKTTLLTGDLAERYSSIFWNLGWSNDSRTIAFKGRNRATRREELVVVDVEQPDHLEILYTGPGVLADFTFAPDHQSVLFAKTTPGNPEPQLYVVHRKNPGRLELVKNQPTDRIIYDCDWSHDGREIVFTGVPRPVPVDWPIAAESTPAGQNSN